MSRPACAPALLSELIPWMVSHARQWQQEAGVVGLSQQQADAFQQAAAEAQAHYTATLEARRIAQGMTDTQNAAVARALHALSSNLAIIRGFANASGAPAQVYSAARIDPPASPSPAGLPALPTGLRAELDALSGAVKLSWRARNPAGTSGTTYMVSRAIVTARGRPGAYAFIGTAPGSGREGKKFIDTTLPAGAAIVNGVCYLVTGVRSGLTGPAAEVSVRFGAAAEQRETAASAPRAA